LLFSLAQSHPPLLLIVATSVYGGQSDPLSENPLFLRKCFYCTFNRL